MNPTASIAPSAPSLQTRLLKGGAGAFGLRVAALLLGFVADLVLTNTLGLENYGLYAIGISWVSLLVPLGSLGMNTALLKVVPSEGSQGHQGRVRGALDFAAKRMLLASVVLGGLMALGVALAGDRLGGETRAVLFILAGFLPIQVFTLHGQAVLQALKFPVLALLPEQVIRVAVFLGLVLGLWLWRGAELRASDAAWAYGLGMAAALGFTLIWTRKKTPEEVRHSTPQIDARLWWWLALPMCWNTIMRLLNSRADPAMLGWMLGPEGAESAAAYSIANRLASLLLFGTVAINAVAAPWIAELHAQGKRDELQRLVSLAAKGLFAYAVPLALVLIFGGPWILEWFGKDFGGAERTLVLLVVARLITCLAGLVGFLLSMTGHQGRVALWMTLAAALKIGLNLLLIPRWGSDGAAVGTVIMLTVFSGLAWRDVRRLVGIEPTLLASFGFLPRPIVGAPNGTSELQAPAPRAIAEERAA